jgi:hypothetical protein
MPNFHEIANSLVFDFEKAAKEVFSIEEIQNYITDVITERLYNKGLTGSNQTLRTDMARNQNKKFYSINTTKIKKGKGQKTNNVTLKDTGDFHKSFDVKVSDDGFEIIADMWKDDKPISDNFRRMYRYEFEFENDITSLQPKELWKLLNKIVLPELITILTR